ncbi:LapA family protein [Mycobacterium sp.]|uniref:LapA family protein n=1 Tax=Mycobacterium sp. TaxID=1785 RepID=UPI003F99E82A
MRDIRRDRGHSDQSVQDSVRRHGLVVVAAVGLAFVVCLANFALGHNGAGVAAVIAGLLAFGAGMAWLAMDSRRVRQAERDWFINHPAR